MTDFRSSGEKSEVHLAEPSGSFRSSAEKAEAFISEADLSNQFRSSSEKAEAWLSEASKSFFNAGTKVELLMSRNHPYLQDMYGHFVYSMHSSPNRILPIRSLVTYY